MTLLQIRSFLDQLLESLCDKQIMRTSFTLQCDSNNGAFADSLSAMR